MADFIVLPIGWKYPHPTDQQYTTLRENVKQINPDCVVIIGIPRHHAKKVAQQDWTKDYHLSKERSSMTGKRPNVRGAKITIIYSRFPFTSEEWIAPGEGPRELTHIAEICIPLGTWAEHRSPVELLQEYQLSYDEISTISIIALSDANELDQVRSAFQASKLRNSIVFVFPEAAAISDNEDIIRTNPNVCAITELIWWTQEVNGTAINLISDPVEHAPDE